MKVFRFLSSKHEKGRAPKRNLRAIRKKKRKAQKHARRMLRARLGRRYPK